MGSLSTESTYLRLIDPASGTSVVEDFDTLIRKFEQVGAVPIGNTFIQIVHFP